MREQKNKRELTSLAAACSTGTRECRVMPGAGVPAALVEKGGNHRLLGALVREREKGGCSR